MVVMGRVGGRWRLTPLCHLTCHLIPTFMRSFQNDAPLIALMYCDMKIQSLTHTCISPTKDFQVCQTFVRFFDKNVFCFRNLKNQRVYWRSLDSIRGEKGAKSSDNRVMPSTENLIRRTRSL